MVQGHKIPQGWKSTHKFVGAFMRDLQRAEDTPPLTLGNTKTVKDLKKRAERIIDKASNPIPCSVSQAVQEHCKCCFRINTARSSWSLCWNIRDKASTVSQKRGGVMTTCSCEWIPLLSKAAPQTERFALTAGHLPSHTYGWCRLMVADLLFSCGVMSCCRWRTLWKGGAS